MFMRMSCMFLCENNHAHNIMTIIEQKVYLLSPIRIAFHMETYITNRHYSLWDTLFQKQKINRDLFQINLALKTRENTTTFHA